jgi:4-aminobutyrate aminotransferase-like enzyme
MGKTGTMHAWQQEGIRGPDLQTIGKALGGGFIPLSGVLLHQKIFDVLASGSGSLAHGHTFQVCLTEKTKTRTDETVGNSQCLHVGSSCSMRRCSDGAKGHRKR